MTAQVKQQMLRVEAAEENVLAVQERKQRDKASMSARPELVLPGLEAVVVLVPEDPEGECSRRPPGASRGLQKPPEAFLNLFLACLEASLHF